MFTVTKTTQGAYTAYVLADTGAGTTATVVPEKGGMVTSFTKNGDEYSWLREPNFSQPERPRCAMPVLFPMCGRAPQDANTFGGKSYPMIIHGIVHSMPWQVVETGETDGASVTVRVTDNAETRESYPFAFSVTIRYVLRGGELRFEQTYENTGSTDMPFSFGFHPYFRVSDVRNLEWDIKAGLTADPDTGRDTPFEGVDFPYDDEQTTRYYKGVQSPMRFTDKELGHTVTVKFDGNFKNAVLWSQCPLGFVCMEPWNGFPGSLTTPEHETRAPGNALSAVMSIEI